MRNAMTNKVNSIQINYRDAFGYMLTREILPANASTVLDVARQLHEQGNTVGSIGLYFYPSNRRAARTCTIWYNNSNKAYYG